MSIRNAFVPFDIGLEENKYNGTFGFDAIHRRCARASISNAFVQLRRRPLLCVVSPTTQTRFFTHGWQSNNSCAMKIFMLKKCALFFFFFPSWRYGSFAPFKTGGICFFRAIASDVNQVRVIVDSASSTFFFLRNHALLITLHPHSRYGEQPLDSRSSDKRA